MNVCPNLLVTDIAQVRVGVKPRVAIDAASAEFGKCVEVVNVDLVGLHYEIPVEFWYPCRRWINPAIVCELACLFFDSHEAAVSLVESLKEEGLILE